MDLKMLRSMSDVRKKFEIKINVGHYLNVKAFMASNTEKTSCLKKNGNKETKKLSKNR